MKKTGVFFKSGVWMLCVLVLSVLPGSSLDSVSSMLFPHFDKIVHFGMYFTMTVLVLQAFRKVRISFLQSAIYTFFISFAYGLLMEFFQEIFTRKRTGEIWDLLANLSGIILAILIFRLLNKNRIFRRITG